VQRTPRNRSQDTAERMFVCAARFLQSWDNVCGLAAIYRKQGPFLHLETKPDRILLLIVVAAK
jgi:hypothetical protein